MQPRGDTSAGSNRCSCRERIQPQNQDVGAILDTSRGWGVYGRASRVSDLEKELSKHLVVRLTNAFTHIDVAVVHLRVPRNGDGDEKQKDQNRALLRWTMRHLAK